MVSNATEYRDAVVDAVKSMNDKLQNALSPMRRQKGISTDWRQQDLRSLLQACRSVTTNCDAVYKSTQRLHSDIGAAQAAAITADAAPQQGLEDQTALLAHCKTRLQDLQDYAGRKAGEPHTTHEPPMVKFKKVILQQRESSNRVLSHLAKLQLDAEALKKRALRRCESTPPRPMTWNSPASAGVLSRGLVDGLVDSGDLSAVTSQLERSMSLKTPAKKLEAAQHAAQVSLPRPQKPKWELLDSSRPGEASGTPSKAAGVFGSAPNKRLSPSIKRPSAYSPTVHTPPPRKDQYSPSMSQSMRPSLLMTPMTSRGQASAASASHPGSRIGGAGGKSLGPSLISQPTPIGAPTGGPGLSLKSLEPSLAPSFASPANAKMPDLGSGGEAVSIFGNLSLIHI